MLLRLPDWPERLAAVIKAASGRPFSWGDHDCLHLASDVCLAITGHDPGAPWRGAYRSLDGVLALSRHLGFADVETWADHVIGRRIDLREARRGDWVMAQQGWITGNARWVTDAGAETMLGALGICTGRDSLFVHERGLTRRPTLTCQAAWPIGD